MQLTVFVCIFVNQNLIVAAGLGDLESGLWHHRSAWIDDADLEGRGLDVRGSDPLVREASCDA